MIGGIVLVCGTAVAASGQTPPPGGVQIGQPAPDFAVKGISGETLVLSAYRGRPVVLHFFAPWLGWSCWDEMRRLNDAAARYHERGLLVLGVGVRTTPEAVGRWVQVLGLTFPVGLDPTSQLFLYHYHLRFVPTTVFVDREGVVQEIWDGPIDSSSLFERIAQIL